MLQPQAGENTPSDDRQITVKNNWSDDRQITVAEKITVKRLAAVLQEREYKALATVLKVLGEERCVELLVEALTIASQGGMRRKDDRRRKRTLGGVFLELCKQQATREERRRIFG